MTPLIENGKSDWQIVIEERSSAAESWAAHCLQESLRKMTGVRLPVRWGDQRLPYRPAILVGFGRQQAEPGLWDRDSYEITPAGRDLILRGPGQRGTHYAVYAFLESLGARFYGPDIVVLPQVNRVDLPKTAITSTAAFSYRHVFYPTAQEPEWALRWKLNVHSGRDSRWGPNATAHSIGHSFNGLVPVERHFEQHPDYFSLVDGARRRSGAQLCCTNPDVADVACETMARWMAEHPDRRIFAVGMNDWEGWCECPNCTETDRREGTHAGQVLTLVNRVAERFPNRIIATLAYMWAVDAPAQMRARDNVLIVLCHNEGCFNHALAACPHNDAFRRRLEGWKRRADHILIWDYYVNYHSYLMPTPNLRRIQADLRLYRDFGVHGMFCQGSACRGGQFEGLRQYLLARMLWDPKKDAWPIVEEWTRAVYGDGPGRYILDYMEMLHDHVDSTGAHMLSYGRGEEIQPTVFTPEVLARGKELWDRAESAAPDPEVRRRVFAARAPEMCSRLFNAGTRYEVAGGRLAPRPPVDAALRDRFVEAAIAGGAAHLRENDAAPEDFGLNFGRQYEAVVLENERLRAVVVPELGGRIYSIRASGLDVELMRVIDFIRSVNYLPYGAGYEFRLDPAMPGSATEPFDIVERDGSSRLVLRAAFDEALQLDTELTLAADRLHVTHTVANGGRKAVTVSPATHAEWNCDVFGPGVTLDMRKADGTWRSLPVNPEGRPGRELSFAGQELPAGGWRINSPGSPLELEETFDAATVDHVRLAFYLRSSCLDLNLHFKARAIAPGETARFGMTWRFALKA